MMKDSRSGHGANCARSPDVRAPKASPRKFALVAIVAARSFSSTSSASQAVPVPAPTPMPQDPPHVERDDVLGKQKHERADHADDDGGQGGSTPADAIGHATEHQQSGQIPDHIDRIDQRQRNMRESPLLLIDNVKRRHNRAARKEHGNHRGNRRGRGSAP